MTTPAHALLDAKIAAIPGGNCLTRTSDDGRTVVTLTRLPKKAVPIVTVTHDGADVAFEECKLTIASSRVKLAESCGPALFDFVQLALIGLGKVWTQQLATPSETATDQKARLTRDTKPWPEPVDLCAVLDAVHARVIRYLVMPEHGPAILTLWVSLTHWIDAQRRTPYLWLESPTRECGKSTVLDLCKQLTARPWDVSNPSGAALFRTIEAERPTLILDEIDAITGPKLDDLTGLLNDGYQRDGKVARCVGDNHDVRTFSVFCSKVVAGIGATLADATRSRCIRITMTRGTDDELRDITKFREDRAAQWAGPLRQQLARAATDTLEVLRDVLQNPDATEIPEGIYGRDADVWEPLLALADLAGGDWPVRARAACQAFVKARRADDDGDRKVRLLRDLKAFFSEKADDAATSATLIEWLIEDESRGWAEYRGRPLSPHTLALLLKPFKVAPVKRRQGSVTERVWLRLDLVPVWAKYLAPSPTESPATSATSDTTPAAVPRVPAVPLVALVLTGTGEDEDPHYVAALLADEAALEPIEDAA